MLPNNSFPTCQYLGVKISRHSIPLTDTRTNGRLYQAGRIATRALCGKQPADLGHICATVDLRFRLSATQIDQLTTIFFDAYAKATWSCTYSQPRSTSYRFAYSEDFKGHPYGHFCRIGKCVTKGVWQVTQ